MSTNTHSDVAGQRRPSLGLGTLFAMAVLVVAALGVGYIIIGGPDRTLFELNNIRNQHLEQSSRIAELRYQQADDSMVRKAREEFIAWGEQARNRCMEISTELPHGREAGTALLTVTKLWPNSGEAETAFVALDDFAGSASLKDITYVLNVVHANRSDAYRSFVATLIERVRTETEHPDAGEILAKCTLLIAPQEGSKEEPCPEFVLLANMLMTDFSSREGIQNFCELLARNGPTPEWDAKYEGYLRQILELNRDRFVRCSAKFSLALLVHNAEPERKGEAKKLLQEFLREFDGQTQFRAQSIEQFRGEQVQAMLERMSVFSTGKPAPKTVGMDLDGNRLSLEDYRGKVVLVSFWATWCGPCIAAIPHERKLVEAFSPEGFTILGVNGDENPERAIASAKEHGIIWRSLQSRREDGTRIDDKWLVEGWPSFYLVDVNGKIARYWTGLPDDDILRDEISSLIAAGKQN